MKRILFISISDISKRSGAGLATLAYYNAVCNSYPGLVDLMMPLEACKGEYTDSIGVPPRSLLKVVLSGSMHRYKSFLKEYLDTHKQQYYLCIINGGRYAGDMMDIIHEHGLKIMVIHHNFEREYCMDNKTVYTLWGVTPFWVNLVEKKAYMMADCNCFLTHDDMALFQKYYGDSNGKSLVLGVFEPKTITDLSVGDHTQKIIAITGSMNTIQTMCGIKDINDNYYDIIKEICPDWELIIAGRNPNKEVYDLQQKNPNKITVIPNPEVMDDITRPASIYLCPTNVGGGLKLRVMDGLRQGIPVLVHRVSARGYNCFCEKPYFQIYNDQTTFRQGLLSLVHYVESGLNKKKIQSDYLSLFGFERGCEILKNAIDSLCDSTSTNV